jgi:hypothetical protein
MKAVRTKILQVIAPFIILSLFISSLIAFLFLGSCVSAYTSCPICVDEDRTHNLELQDIDDFTTTTALGADSTLEISTTDM